MMILYEQGLWDLEDAVSKFIPEFEGLQVAVENGRGEIQQVPQDHPMTMRELMTHTGGLTYGPFSQSAVDTMYQQVRVLDRDSTLQAMIDEERIVLSSEGVHGHSGFDTMSFKRV